MEELTKYWVGFNLVKGIGPVRLEGLLKYFGDIHAAWMANEEQLIAAGLNSKLCRKLVITRMNTDLDSLMDQINQSGVEILTWDHTDYPDRLRRINQSPFVLYLKGNLAEEDLWSAAIVGTRRYTDYGRQVTEEITRVLASNGVTVISGLARGIDGIAHKVALEHGGRTLAVLGSGLDQIYPPEHIRLSGKIIEQGALISDYPPGTPPDGSNFPPRNRIISGLSRVVIVIEAGQKSGALITAGYAADQGKEVLAVPGRIHSPMSKGTNLLIKQGAHPLVEPRDVLDLLNLELVAEQNIVKRVLPASPKEAVVFQAVGEEPQHVDEIRNTVNMPIEEVTSTLALLELKGLVRKTYGMKYIAVRDMVIDYRSGKKLDNEGK